MEEIPNQSICKFIEEKIFINLKILNLSHCKIEFDNLFLLLNNLDNYR